MKKLFAKTAILLTFTMLISTSVFTQPPLPPSHGEPEDQPAPIGSGLGILLALGAAYGAKKVYDARKKFKK